MNCSLGGLCSLLCSNWKIHKGSVSICSYFNPSTPGDGVGWTLDTSQPTNGSVSFSLLGGEARSPKDVLLACWQSLQPLPSHLQCGCSSLASSTSLRVPFSPRKETCCQSRRHWKCGTTCNKAMHQHSLPVMQHLTSPRWAIFPWFCFISVVFPPFLLCCVYKHFILPLLSLGIAWQSFFGAFTTWIMSFFSGCKLIFL